MEIIKNLIKLAKEKGYVPEKREEKEYFTEELLSTSAFNQAIDSYNLEKIIELGIEMGKKDVIKIIDKEIDIYNDRDLYILPTQGTIEILDNIINQISPNKEE